MNSRHLFFSAVAILALMAPAYAVKPQAPVTVVCSTVDQKGFVYTAECHVEAHGDHFPADVRISSLQDKGTLIVKYNSENTSGLGKWIIVFEVHEQKPLPVLFDVHYPDGTMIRATAIYDPLGMLTKPKTGAPAGVIKGKKGGGGVKEYPSN